MELQFVFGNPNKRSKSRGIAKKRKKSENKKKGQTTVRKKKGYKSQVRASKATKKLFKKGKKRRVAKNPLKVVMTKGIIRQPIYPLSPTKGEVNDIMAAMKIDRKSVV